jgi:hypothetical protein
VQEGIASVVISQECGMALLRLALEEKIDTNSAAGELVSASSA